MVEVSTFLNKGTLGPSRKLEGRDCEHRSGFSSGVCCSQTFALNPGNSHWCGNVRGTVQSDYTDTVLTVDGRGECRICKGSVVELPNNWKRAA